MENVKFYEMHIFKYSKRKGTRAATMDGQIPEETKNERSSLLLAMAQADSKRFREYYIGKETEVLFRRGSVPNRAYETICESGETDGGKAG